MSKTAEDLSPFDIVSDPKDGFLKQDFFSSLEFDSDVIFDVGVCRGTDWLYSSFPDAKFVLFDPLPGFETQLRKPPENYTIEPIGLGAKPGEMSLDVRGPRSSVHSWKKGNHKSEGSVVVKIDTLENAISKHSGNRTIGLKLDTEGHEVEILKGLGSNAESIEFIVCECSIRPRFEDDYRFSQLVGIAAQKGFELYNFLSRHQPRPMHYDCLFLPAGDKRFGLGRF